MLNDSSSPKEEVNNDHFFLPSLLDQRQQSREVKTKIPIIIQGSMPESDNLITFQKLQAYMQQQQQIMHSQDALTNHYLNISQIIKQIQGQQIAEPQVEEQFKLPKKITKSKSLVKNASSINLKQTPSVQEIKGNVKNAYIKKITSLLNLTDQPDDDSSSDASQDYNQRQFYKALKHKGILGSTQDLLGMDEKNVKMKESAKNSRMRKKVYITMLEKKVEEFQEKIVKYQQGTINSMRFVESTLQRQDSIHGLVVGQVQLQTQIRQSLQKENPVEDNSLLMDSFQMRYGTSGIKRKAYMQFCFANLGRILLQSNYGMLLFAAGNKRKDRSIEFNDYVQEFKQVTGVTDENQIYRTLSIINQLIDHRQRQELLMKRLAKEFNKLRRHQFHLDDTVNSMMQVMTPVQQAQFVEECSGLTHSQIVAAKIQEPAPLQFEADEDDFLDLEGRKKVCF